MLNSVVIVTLFCKSRSSGAARCAGWPVYIYNVSGYSLATLRNDPSQCLLPQHHTSYTQVIVPTYIVIMARGLLLMLAFCALAAAMVNRERRAVNTEDEGGAAASTTVQQIIYCEPQTPCAWSVYKPGLKFLAVNITNSYCICTPDTICQEHEDDTNVNAFVYRCRPPPEEEVENSER